MPSPIVEDQREPALGVPRVSEWIAPLVVNSLLVLDHRHCQRQAENESRESHPMPRTVSAADANRQFSEILRHAAGGETVVITRRGEPVAQIGPVGPAGASDGREAARARLIATLERGVSLGGHRFDRDSLYDR